MPFQQLVALVHKSTQGDLCTSPCEATIPFQLTKHKEHVRPCLQDFPHQHVYSHTMLVVYSLQAISSG